MLYDSLMSLVFSQLRQKRDSELFHVTGCINYFNSNSKHNVSLLLQEQSVNGSAVRINKGTFTANDRRVVANVVS